MAANAHTSASESHVGAAEIAVKEELNGRKRCLYDHWPEFQAP